MVVNEREDRRPEIRRGWVETWEQKDGRAQEEAKENKKEQKGGKDPPSMYFIVFYGILLITYEDT